MTSENLMTLAFLAVAVTDAMIGCWFIFRARNYKENGHKYIARITDLSESIGKFRTITVEFMDDAGTTQNRKINVNAYKKLELSAAIEIYDLAGDKPKTQTGDALQALTISGAALFFTALLLVAGAFVIPPLVIKP